MSKDNAEDIVRQRDCGFNAGRHGEAIELCQRGLARQPGEPMLSHLLAAVLFARGDTAPARRHVEASLARRPDNAAARLLAARLAPTAGEFDAALTHPRPRHRAEAAARCLRREGTYAGARRPQATGAEARGGDPEGHPRASGSQCPAWPHGLGGW